MTPAHQSESHADRSAETRDRILEAALTEFAANGLAGARTGAIAAAAGVNKALLYYYFESKEKLYAAALEMIAERIRDRSMAILLREGISAGERLLRAALEHFDRILTQREFQSLMQQEMIRLHKGEDAQISILAKHIFTPLHERFRALMREGMESGEIVDTDYLQVMLAAIGGNVFYFLSAPMWRITESFEPFEAATLKARRVAIAEFLGQAIFKDRKRGAELAAKVLADTPMPELGEFKGAGPIP